MTGQRNSVKILGAIELRDTRFHCIVIAGRSASGKTIAALDLATSLDEERWRVFYVSMRHETSEDHLAEGIKRRSSRPTIFVIDDAHLDLDKVDHVLDRIESTMVGGRVNVVVVSQSGSGDEDVPGVDEMDVVKRYREEGLVLDLDPDMALYGEILRRAGVDALSDERVEKLFHLTGRDLVLLDEALHLLSSGEMAVEQPSLEVLHQSVLRRYFRRHLCLTLPGAGGPFE